MSSKKVYIPTTSLNFNCIMASESISPPIFYEKRRFGYKRFEKSPLNNDDFRIFVYDSLPFYAIEDDENDNYPMIFELELSESVLASLVPCNEGVFYSEKTIYLAQNSTRIIFFNEAAKATTLAKSQQSIETKMGSFYTIEVITDSVSLKNYEAFPILEKSIATDEIELYVQKDFFYDKLKGFIYGYAIGKYHSPPPHVVKAQKALKDFSNTFSAILSNAGNDCNHIQKEQLDDVARELDIFFDKKNNIKNRAEQLLRKKADETGLISYGFTHQKLEEILNELGTYDLFKKDNGIFHSDVLSEIEKILRKDKPEKSLSYKEYYGSLSQQIQEETFLNKEQIDISKIPYFDGYKLISDYHEGKHTQTLLMLNTYLESTYNIKDFKQNKREFCLLGGKALREEMKNNWENSNEKKYINELIVHLAKYEKFDLKSNDNLLLQSFAAFCQKGEDVELLKDYLVSQDIHDFTIAFALWGIVCGFSEMPKTLTMTFFDKNDVFEFCKYTFEQVNGQKNDYNEKANSGNINLSNIASSKIYTQHETEKETFVSDIKENDNTYKTLVSSFSYNEKNELFNLIRNAIKKKSDAGKRLDDILNALNCKYTNINELHIALKDLIGKTEKWKLVSNFLMPVISEVEKNIAEDAKKRIELPLLKAREHNLQKSNEYTNIEQSDKKSYVAKDEFQLSFLYDKECWLKISHVIPENAGEKIRKKLRYLYANYENGNYKTEPKDNKNVIEKFVWLICTDFNRKDDDDMKIKQFDIIGLIENLSEIYNISSNDLINTLRRNEKFHHFL